ncbi:MAG: exopolysaccharide biosynthesis protein [Octadecabacter sp.]|nr:exopolysaccharide biosynthesis protein [Octadecabacter sp.]
MSHKSPLDAETPEVEAPPPASLPEIIDRVLDAAHVEVVDLRTVLRSFGRASFTPILLLPALAVATPLSGIPLFSSLMGVMIALVSAQMLLQRRSLWLPDWILRREVKGAALAKAFTRIRPVAVWVDRHTAERFRAFVSRPLVWIPQALCLVSGLIMPPLEFVPFSSSTLGVGVSLLALGMLTRDGVLTVVGLLPYGLVVWLVMRVVQGG